MRFHKQQRAEQSKAVFVSGILEGFLGLSWAYMRITWADMSLHELTWAYLDLLGLTWTYWAHPGSPELHAEIQIEI